MRRYPSLYRSRTAQTLAYFRASPGHVPHVTEARWAEVFVVAPATCNSIGKLVAGVTDNFPLLVLRAVPRSTKVIVVPSMNPEMWHDPQLQRNIDLLNATEKYRVICPRRGQMLSGDEGFGAQAPFEDIVAETYLALGIVSETADAALTGRTTRLPGNGSDAARLPDPGAGPCVVLIDEDGPTRQLVAASLGRAHPDYRIEQFGNASQALGWAREHRASLVVTELSFTSGVSGFDVIDHFRRLGSDRSVTVIATSARDRREVGAERLARDDVLFHPKPLNVPFLVGMISGCLGAGSHTRTAVGRIAL